MPLDVAGLQLLTGLLHGLGHADQLIDLAGWRTGVVIALTEPAHHADDTGNWLGQLIAQAPRTQPHPGKKQQIEHAQADDQPIADLQITLGQAVGLPENILFIDHQQQAPTGLRNLAPGHQLLAPTEHDLLHTALTGRHGLQ
ncbi:hypothetical protein D3C86_1613480 [compost metagenome]